MKKDVELGPEFLAATKSVFGWTIHGISNPSNPPHDISTLMIGVEPSEPEPLPDEDQIEFDLREFWRLEHMGVLETEETEPSFLESRSVKNQTVDVLPAFHGKITDTHSKPTNESQK